jgi:hypothetical protein
MQVLRHLLAVANVSDIPHFEYELRTVEEHTEDDTSLGSAMEEKSEGSEVDSDPEDGVRLNLTCFCISNIVKLILYILHNSG